MTTGFVEAARREKLKELLERGVAPFAYRFERTATAQQAIAAYTRDDDLRIDVFRASGKGGQHVNKTSSAVRITHLPTGIVVSCQQERSQGKNKATAMKMLKARLYERAVREREAKKAEVDKQKTDIAWGNQIRSYVFQPYTMVNDHRTELKVSDVHKVMDGDLDPFIEAFLQRFGSNGK